MDYIKKKELKDGDIFVAQLSNYHFLNKEGTEFSLDLKTDNTIKVERLIKGSGFSYKNIRMATSEEKHWLNTCITADKFITFEEAMKTFIPEYVELINTDCRINCNIPAGKIYKCSKDVTKTYHFGFFLDSKYRIGFNKNEFNQYLKPSTKEAYDAQFVVKEPEFVLPEKWCISISEDVDKSVRNWFNKMNSTSLYTTSNNYFKYLSWIGIANSDHWTLYIRQDHIQITFEQFKKYVLKEETAIEFGNKIDKEIIEQPIIENKTELEIWLENTKSLNLSLEDLEKYIGSGQTCNFDNIYMKLEGNLTKGRAKILFDKWNNKIIEPLPQFKVIETIETITKVENNEGNQFFIGDVVKSNYSEVIHNIKGFKYNVDKTNILAITEKLPGGIGIDKIEHYIEPKTDYQILEYKTEGGISCKAPFLADSHQFYINERCKIYSIKRISDDLIITVGDEVLSKTCGVPNKILSIELINNKIRLYPRNSFYNLEDILKINNK